MTHSGPKIAAWLKRRAENAIAGLMAIMFAAFVLQIVFRYFFNFPVGWTSELTVIAWLWMVLFGSAFVLTESEEIRFDLIHSAVSGKTRRLMGIAAGAALVAFYAMSLPAALNYVTFMKVEKSAYLHIRLDWLYSIYVIFAAAIIVRYVWIVWRLLRGKNIEAVPPDRVGSGL
jgi:C4-dicarboxylate transporter DctQ subunit